MHATSRQCPKQNTSLFLNSPKQSYWLPQKPVPSIRLIDTNLFPWIKENLPPSAQTVPLETQEISNSSPATYLLNKYLQTTTIQACSYCFHYFAHKGPYSQSYGFSNCYVWMWELDHKECWELKNLCFRIVVLEKTLESPFGLQGDQTSQS